MSKKNEQSIRNNIAIRLVNYRNEHQLTQQQMADKINESRSNYSKIEARKYKPTVDRLILIAELMNITMKELIGSCAISSHS